MTDSPKPDNLRRAINLLTMEKEFFASLLFEMRLVEVDDSHIPRRIFGPGRADQDFPFTMATDGTHLYWSRNFVSSLSVPLVSFALCHEVVHPMLLHIQRLYEHAPSGNNWVPKADSRGQTCTCWCTNDLHYS